MAGRQAPWQAHGACLLGCSRDWGGGGGRNRVRCLTWPVALGNGPSENLRTELWFARRVCPRREQAVRECGRGGVGTGWPIRRLPLRVLPSWRLWNMPRDVYSAAAARTRDARHVFVVKLSAARRRPPMRRRHVDVGPTILDRIMCVEDPAYVSRTVVVVVSHPAHRAERCRWRSAFVTCLVSV